MSFAGFWRRVAAHLMDLAVVFGGLWVIFSLNLAWQGVRWSHLKVFWLRTLDELDYMFGLFITFWVAIFQGAGALKSFFSQTLRADALDQFATLDVYILDALALGAVVAIMKGVSEASIWQATPGKRFMGLHIVDVMGRRLTFGHALARATLGVVSYSVAGLPFVWALISPRRQAFHDYWSGTLVVTHDNTSATSRYPTWS